MINGCLNEYKPEETAIIILGDAGFNFYLNNTDNKVKRQVNARGYRFYCVRGNHEARPQDINGMDFFMDEEVDGMVYCEPDYPNIRYFADFSEYMINGYKVAVIGGAYSVDKWWRLHNAGIYSKLDKGYFNPKKTGWFYNEQLNDKEMGEAFNLLKDKSYDFVLTHTCPISWEPIDLFLSSIDQNEVDTSMENFLENLKDNIQFKAWLFAHFHRDRLERPHVEQYYNDIESLDTIWQRWNKYDTDGTLDWWLVKGPQYYMA